MRKIFFSLLILIFSAGIGRSEIVNLSNYEGGSTVGSWWTYSYIYPSGLDDFTVSITKITSGKYNGKLRIGDWYKYHPSDPEIRWTVYDISDGDIITYEDSGETFDPPLVVNIENLEHEQELECFVNCTVYPYPDINPYPTNYLRKEEKITVPAGTFYDILVKFHIDSDKAFPPNSANDQYGLDPVEVPYSVTHIRWNARDIGEVQCIDIDSKTGDIVHCYKLKSFKVGLAVECTGIAVDIKGNNSDGPITSIANNDLSITVELNTGSCDNTDADWWIAADTPFGLFFLTLDGWTTDWQRVYQGPLVYLDSLEVLNIPVSELPAGKYTFCFGIDTNMDGDITWDNLYYDTLEVNITP